MYIGIGSNIDPEKNLAEAAQLLREEFPDIAFSSVYRSAPQIEEDQDDFLNAVAKIQTEETAEVVHEILKDIEQRLKKNPPKRFGPRTIDLDLLLYGQEGIAADNLTVPHPRMHERRFVLEPLCELIDEESQTTWENARKSVEHQSCQKTDILL